MDVELGPGDPMPSAEVTTPEPDVASAFSWAADVADEDGTVFPVTPCTVIYENLHDVDYAINMLTVGQDISQRLPANIYVY